MVGLDRDRVSPNEIVRQLWEIIAEVGCWQGPATLLYWREASKREREAYSTAG